MILKIALLLSILISPSLVFALNLSGVVSKIHYGDSFSIKDEAGIIRRIRIRDIDAPEPMHSLGDRSRNNLEKQISGSHVLVVEAWEDIYGRYVGDVLVKRCADCLFVNIGHQILSEGMAKYRKSKATRNNKALSYIAAESVGRYLKLGVWGKQEKDNPIPERGIFSKIMSSYFHIPKERWGDEEMHSRQQVIDDKLFMGHKISDDDLIALHEDIHFKSTDVFSEYSVDDFHADLYRSSANMKLQRRKIRLGMHENANVIAEFLCGDLCPKYMSKVIRYDVPIDLCDRVGGVVTEKSIGGFFRFRAQVCVPKLLIGFEQD